MVFWNVVDSGGLRHVINVDAILYIKDRYAERVSLGDEPKAIGSWIIFQNGKSMMVDESAMDCYSLFKRGGADIAALL